MTARCDLRPKHGHSSAVNSSASSYPSCHCWARLAVAIAMATAMTTLASGPAHAEPATKVFLNGVPAPVYFNDGDSFRVLGGKYHGTKARLAGYNSLESYGRAHQWGKWTADEMFVLAKMATNRAKKGVWRCTTDGKADTYGRMLFWCPELAEDLIRSGLAHVLSVNESPGDPKLIAAQQEAIAARRGMWAHGVPDYVLTSLHSIAEDTDGRNAYNRIVSTTDGHSNKWIHDENYDECQNVCDDGGEAKSRLDKATAALKADPAVGPMLAGVGGARKYDNDLLDLIASDFARGKDITKRMARPEHLPAFAAVLQKLKDNGELGRAVKLPACMIYVDFRRRFGGGRAACLK